jgi:hypothetical protein
MTELLETDLQDLENILRLLDPKKDKIIKYQ